MTDSLSNPLWVSIQNFEIGLSKASLSFTDRLARENGWSREFAERVVEEYRRFCYLAMTAGHPVTPSEEVDQAWHLHLLYSENYWSEFCGGVLRRPLHHGPTRGGRREDDKYRDWFQATLDSYARVFGEDPPVDVWPAVDARFRDASRFRRVNTASHWVIPKPTRRSVARWLAPAISLPILGACAIAGDGRQVFLPIIGAIVVLLVVFGFVHDRATARRRRNRRELSPGTHRADERKRADGSTHKRWWWGGGDHSGPGSAGCGGSGCGSSGCGGGGCGS